MSTQQNDLSVQDAIDYLDGHTILSVDGARMVCLTLGVTLDEALILSWQTVEEAWETYGFHTSVSPGQGVDGLSLSYHVAHELGITDPPGRHFSGKGFQSKANQQAIREKLSEAGKLL